ncbi:bifunctional riboflavin kinase/FAD synthetase [Rothia sp. P7208]|uniref:bifunctional riboflavin kinase/FAD synthetase n=1 Tax=Rothia sp. P7208 TaxID=3402660 RepID=UPI003AD26991
MDVYRHLNDMPAQGAPSVVTLGNFDGVHTGHIAVLKTVVDYAQQHGLRSVAISFDPHPARVHRPEVSLEEIMGQDDRQVFLEEVGIEHYLLMEYTHDFSLQSPEEFVESTFVHSLNAKYVVIGEDVRFGRNNSGDLATMRQLGQRYGFEVVTVADLKTDDGERVSSTRIRELLAHGKVHQAAKLLGRPHRMRGEIVHGAARGRLLGFPTANMSADAEGFIPADGVYAGWLIDEAGTRHPVATSVGTNPTFEGITRRQVEAHVLGRPEEPIEDFNLYGQHVVLEFTEHLRDMVAYTGVDALIEQISQDVIDAQRVLFEEEVSS